MRPGGDFPQLLHANAVGLRIAILHEIELLDQLLGQRSARALGKHHDLGFDVIAGLEVRLRLILFVDALVVGAHTSDAIAIVEKLGNRRIR